MKSSVTAKALTYEFQPLLSFPIKDNSIFCQSRVGSYRQIGHNGVWVVVGRLEGGKLKKGKHKLISKKQGRELL